MNELKRYLRDTAVLYRDYSARLTQWAEDSCEAKKLDDRLADLALMESEFMESSHKITRSVEEGRKQQSRRAGRDLTLHEWASSEGALAEFEEAAAAVAEVSRKRVEALRSLEAIRDKIKGERDKISRAKKTNSKYTRPRESGRRLNGQA